MEQSTSDKSNLTPHALVRKQIENEEFHVSGEDMANLDTSIQPPEQESKELGKQLDDNVEGKKQTPFDILGE